MMMTACDLSAITKPWEVQSKVGSLLETCLVISSLLPFALIVLSALMVLGCSNGGSRILGAGRPRKDSSWAATYCKLCRLCVLVCYMNCVFCCKVTIFSTSFVFSLWWTEIMPMSCLRCSVALSTLSAPLYTRYRHTNISYCSWMTCIF